MQAQDTLIGRLAAGESGAPAECMERFGGLVWALARRFSTNSADAEDAVQEIFSSLWQNADRFDPSIASETTFVGMIARRRLIDRRRGFDYSELHPDVLFGLIAMDIQHWAVRVLERRFGKVSRKVRDAIRDTSLSEYVEMVCQAYTCPDLKSFLSFLQKIAA